MGGKVLELETDKFIKKIRDKYKDELEAEIKDEVKEEIKEAVKAEAKEEVVIRMLKRGRNTLDEIVDDTGLPLERVKRIKEEQQL